jgi:hypothetical protein
MKKVSLNNTYTMYIGCFFKFHLKVGVEESIVNAPLPACRMQNKNTNNAQSEVSWSVICNPWCVHNRLFEAYFKVKLKKKHNIMV